MPCPHCASAQVSNRSRLTRFGYKTFSCNQCHRTFNERTGSPFNRRQAQTTTIYKTVFERLRYKLSLSDVAEMLWVEGFYFSRETVRQWEREFAPLITDELQKERLGHATKRWKADETLLKIKSKFYYFYRAIDSAGQLVASKLFGTRNMANTKAFFEQAVAITHQKPEQVTTDKEVSYPGAIEAVLGKGVEHRTGRYRNNRLEQDHRGIKARYRPMLSFKHAASAAIFCEAYDEQRQFFKVRRWHKDKRSSQWKRSNFKSKYLQLKYKFSNRKLVWRQTIMPLQA